MTDTVSKEKRSEIMSKIKSTGTSIEGMVLAHLPKKGLVKYERGVDFLYPEKLIAVRVMGCFWHGCPLHCKMPKTNVKFWGEKILRNTERDSKVKERLRRQGWVVIDIWEHDIREENEQFLAEIDIVCLLVDAPF